MKFKIGDTVKYTGTGYTNLQVRVVTIRDDDHVDGRIVELGNYTSHPIGFVLLNLANYNWKLVKPAELSGLAKFVKLQEEIKCGWV